MKQERTVLKLNISPGIQQFSAEMAEGAIGLRRAEGLVSSTPPGLRVLRGTIDLWTAGALGELASIHAIYRIISGASVVKVVARTSLGTTSKASTSTTAITGATYIPPKGTGLYSSTYFRDELILASENEPPASLKIADDGLSVVATTLDDIPAGGLVAGHMNRVFIGGCSEAITHEQLKIPASVVGYGSPISTKFEVLATRISFGHLVVFGASSSRAVQLYNGFHVPVRVTGVTCDGVNFVVSGAPNLPASVPPGGFISIDVQCVPEEEGHIEGTLLVSTDMAVLQGSETAGWSAGTNPNEVEVDSGINLQANALRGCYLVNGDNTYQYEIVGNEAVADYTSSPTLVLRLNTETIHTNTDEGWKIIVDPSMTVPLDADVSYDPFVCEPSFISFPLVVLGAVDADFPVISLTYPNPMANEFTLGNIVYGDLVEMVRYALNDADWVGVKDSGVGVYSTLTLTCEAKKWIPDEWIGITVTMDGGSGVVTDNTETVLTFASVTGTPVDGPFTMSRSAPSTFELQPKKSLRVQVRPVAANLITGVNEESEGIILDGSEEANPNRVWWTELKNSNKCIKARSYIDFKDNEGDAGRNNALVSVNNVLVTSLENAIYLLTGYSDETFRREELPMSRGRGFINPRAWCIVDGTLFYVSFAGVFSMMGLQLMRISDPIIDEWIRVIENPSSIDLKAGDDCLYLICKYERSKIDYGHTFTWDSTGRTVTVSGKAWTTSEWALGTFVDRNGDEFEVGANSGNVLTLSGAGEPEEGPFMLQEYNYAE